MENTCPAVEKSLAPYQRIAIVFWLTMIAISISTQIIWPQYFSAKKIGAFLILNNHFAVSLFLILVCLRPLILVPGTVLVFAGLIIFDPLTVFVLSMIGVVISGTGVYFFSNLAGFDRIIQARYPQHIQKLTPSIQKYGTPFIAAWSAFPFVPDDLICYLTGAIRFSYWRFLIAFTVGGALPIAVYSFGGAKVFDYFF